MAKKGASKTTKKKQQNSDPIVIGIIGFIAIVIIGIIVYSKLPKQPTVKPASITYTNTSGLTMGDPNAKVKVVEFADFQCPFCQQYESQLEPTIISKYIDTGKVYYSVNVMAFLGQESIDTALAAYCANDQGKFWEYRALIASNYPGENTGYYTTQVLEAFAKKLNLDTTTFNECLTSGKHQQDITASESVAQNAGVNSTPSFLVDGIKVSSSDLESTIEKELAK